MEARALWTPGEPGISAYRRDGYLIARGLFDSSEIEELREVFTAMGARGPVAGLSDTGGRLNPGEPLARWPRMMHPHRHPELPVGPLALRIMLDERLHGILRELLADEVLAAQSMFYFKPPGARGQDLHQDNFYLRVKPGNCMAAWIAVDDADRENGGMVAVPGSQHCAISCPEQSRSEKFFTSEHVPVPAGLREVPINLKAGDCFFFNGSVIHGSYPNVSASRFRRAFICHYVPISSAEVSQWYRPLLSFEQKEVAVASAIGGGPCGTATGEERV